MKNQRYPEGYMVAVHTRAGAYPLQGWFVRRQRPPSGTPLVSRGPAPPGPPVAPGVGYPVLQRSGGLDGAGGSAYTPPGLVVPCGVGISVVSVRERWCLYPTRVVVTFSWCRFEIAGIGYIVSIRSEVSFVLYRRCRLYSV